MTVMDEMDAMDAKFKIENRPTTYPSVRLRSNGEVIAELSLTKVKANDLEAIRSLVRQAYQIGVSQARREMRKALGIEDGGA